MLLSVPATPATAVVAAPPPVFAAGLDVALSGRAPTLEAVGAAVMAPPSRVASLTEEAVTLAQQSPAPRTQAKNHGSGAAATPTRVVVRAPSRVDTASTVDRLLAQGVEHVRVRPATFAAVSVQARYFHRQDRARAARILAALGSPASPSDFTTLRPAPPRGYVEVWLPAPFDMARR